MSIISDTLDSIVNRTGLMPKGRNFTADIDSNNSVRFEVTAKELKVWGTLKGDKEKLSQVVTLDKAASYIHGYLFSYGFISERGEKITSPNQLKYENNAMKKQTKKALVKTTTKTATSTKKKKVAYGLGKPIKKADRNKLIKQLEKENILKPTRIMRITILANWDNESCIDAVHTLVKDRDMDYVESDVNKVRRQLRRKGDWK